MCCAVLCVVCCSPRQAISHHASSSLPDFYPWVCVHADTSHSPRYCIFLPKTTRRPREFAPTDTKANAASDDDPYPSMTATSRTNGAAAATAAAAPAAKIDPVTGKPVDAVPDAGLRSLDHCTCSPTSLHFPPRALRPPFRPRSRCCCCYCWSGAEARDTPPARSRKGICRVPLPRPTMHSHGQTVRNAYANKRRLLMGSPSRQTRSSCPHGATTSDNTCYP